MILHLGGCTMTKPCSICSQPEAVQERVSELHQRGESQREIESVLATEFSVNVSYSAIGRHLKHGETQGEHPKENASAFQDIVNTPKPDGADMHNALCHILHQGIEMFFQRMKETGEKTTPYNVHLETYRCLEMLIKMLENLYPDSGKLAEIKAQKQREVEIRNLTGDTSDFHQHVLYKMLTLKRKMTPDEYRKYVNTAIDHATYGYKEENEEIAEEKDSENPAEESNL